MGTGIIEEFEIRCDVVCSYNDFFFGNEDKNISRLLGVFLESKNYQQKITNLYEDFLNRNANQEILPCYLKWKGNLSESGRPMIPTITLDGDCMSEMSKQLRREIYNTRSSDYRFYIFSNEIYPLMTSLWGIVLNQSVKIDRIIDSNYFCKFFGYILDKQKDHVHACNFIDYHLKRNFNDNLKDYRKFLLDLSDISPRRTRLLQEWLGQNSVTSLPQENEGYFITRSDFALKELFVSPSTLQRITKAMRDNGINIPSGTLLSPMQQQQIYDFYNTVYNK